MGIFKALMVKRLQQVLSDRELAHAKTDGTSEPHRHRIRDLKNIAVHALLCVIAMLLTALAALSLKRAERARSITLLGK
jgi:hypothetical protein